MPVCRRFVVLGWVLQPQRPGGLGVYDAWAEEVDVAVGVATGECVCLGHPALLGALIVFGDGAVGQGESPFSVEVVFPESADDRPLFSEGVYRVTLAGHDVCDCPEDGFRGDGRDQPDGVGLFAPEAAEFFFQFPVTGLGSEPALLLLLEGGDVCLCFRVEPVQLTVVPLEYEVQGRAVAPERSVG